MGFCGNCGTALKEGITVCGSCGEHAHAPSSAVMQPMLAPATSSAPVNAATVPVVAGTAMAANVAGALAYLLGAVTGILFLVLDPYRSDRLVRFHAFQSIFFFAVWMVGGITWNIVGGAISVATGGVLSLIMIPLGFLIFLASLGYWIFVMYQAYANERYEIPLIGKLAAKQAG
jgi:uncharacterized membrane protein